MKLKELFRQLSYGELSNLAISDSGSGSLVLEKYPQVIQYTNDALTALHSRFVIKEKDLLIEQFENITRYFIDEVHTQSYGSPDHAQYIIDLYGEHYKGDLIRILSVYDSCGCKFPLNDEENCNSLYTPQPHTLQIPNPVRGVEVSIIYQANHEKLVDVAPDDVEDENAKEAYILDQDIDIPVYLENALKIYIGYKVFNDMNGQENNVKAFDKYRTYEAICLEVEQRDLVNQTYHTSHGKLENRGFV